LYGEVIAVGRSAGLPVLTACALQHLGTFALQLEGDAALAASYLEEAVALERAADERWLGSLSLAVLGYARSLQGDSETAIRLLLVALDLTQALPFSMGNIAIPMGLGLVAMAAGQPDRTARLCGIAEAIAASNGLRGVAGAEGIFQQLTTGARAALGEAAFEAARAAGRAMPRADALAYLRADVRAAPDGKAEGLSPREREVAALVARGQSNREIAVFLVIGERTVETHVRRILQKLGFERRAQIIAWAAGMASSTHPDTAGHEA
jgi:non-specific serine/threonine protein kinase